jgi:hypothetical protein
MHRHHLAAFEAIASSMPSAKAENERAQGGS